MKTITLRRALPSMFAVFGLVAACSSPPPPPPAGGGKKVDIATAGSVTGRASFAGPPPAVESIRMNTDKVCVQGAGPNPQSDAVLIGADGALKNVFVYVKDGLDPAYSFDVPTSAAILDQQGCIYTPRVIGVRAGQPFEVVNSDMTLHNVHAMPMQNQEFNQGQLTKGVRLTRTFTVPEVMVRFKCDVHPWMAAYIGVVAHPYFAVTDANGAFELKDLPPGSYTLEAWHERFGRRTAQITVGAKQPQTVAFSFAAKQERP